MSELKIETAGDQVLRELNGLAHSFDRRYGGENQGSNTCLMGINMINELKKEVSNLEKENKKLKIPEGYAIVPVEPTDEMLSHAKVMCGASHPDYEFDHKECWDSMLRAASSNIKK